VPIKDLSDLPAGFPERKHFPPVAQPIFAQALLEAWGQVYVPEDDKPHAAPSRIRHSDAGRCARFLGYRLTDAEVSNPLTVADYYRFWIGQLVHTEMQEIAAKKWPGCEIEFITVNPVTDAHGLAISSGHGDLLIVLKDRDGRRYALEIKTLNGFGFQKAIGFRGDAEGPRSSALIQGALNAHLHDADVLVLLVLSIDCIAAGQATKAGFAPWQRFMAEWHYERNQFQPIAEQELARFEAIVTKTDTIGLPARSIPSLPAGALITNPAKGRWTVEQDGRIFSNGSTWECDYCPFQLSCTEDADNGV